MIGPTSVDQFEDWYKSLLLVILGLTANGGWLILLVATIGLEEVVLHHIATTSVANDVTLLARSLCTLAGALS